MTETEKTQGSEDGSKGGPYFYKVRFRVDGQEFTAESEGNGFLKDDVIMAKTDHGLEPALIIGPAPVCSECKEKRGSSYELARRLTSEEKDRYSKLPDAERYGFKVCSKLIEKHKLEMSLIRVEKFFNGSKMIFYFTADNRVDFRQLVKDLVQEFRTRVEMRQVGVRHETKMLGGLGTCGRELCCSSYMKKFDSVSIKMAKEQDLPLNPSKISGVCNRLLCCLNYEFETYCEQRKKMPKIGSRLKKNGEEYKVKRQILLLQQLVVQSQDGEEIVLDHKEWQELEVVKDTTKKKKRK